jgi:5-methylcytosine-specific restriction endonuclease McrA
MDTKTCSKCGETKPATTEFWHRQKAGLFGFTSAYHRSHYKANKNRIAAKAKRYYSEHPELVRERRLRYRETHGEQLAEYRRLYRAQNIEEDRRRQREYAREHAEENRERGRKWYAENRERVLVRSAGRYAENRAALREYRRAYYRSHRDGYYAADMRCRARKANAPGRHTAADVAAIRAEQGNKCFWCGEPLGRSYHVDHYIPLSKGGSNWPENLDVSCAPCNQSKGDKLPGEFLERVYA